MKIDRVFARPADLALREVLGDVLQQQQDPRGELIALQFAIARKQGTAAIRKRVRELIEQHVATFAGPIAKVASTLESKHCLELEHGFLGAVELDRRLVPRAAWVAAARAPHWATVHTVKLSVLTTPQWWIAAWAKNPAATRNLRVINVSTGLVLDRDKVSDPWRVTRCLREHPYGAMLTAFATGNHEIVCGPKLPKTQRALVTAALT